MSREPGQGPPPGTGPTIIYSGPWFSTQLTLSLSLGLVSFLLFSYARTRWPVLYAPRTKLKGFSPHEAHAHGWGAYFGWGWIWPTIRTSEYTILQIVGLDAAVLLNFYKMSAILFAWMSVFAVVVIMPINLKANLSLFPEDDPPSNSSSRPQHPRMQIHLSPNSTAPNGPSSWLDLISDTNTTHSLQLLSTYIFTLLTLHFLRRTYTRFTASRQLYALELLHSIPARTVLVSNIPPKLRGERQLAVYFERMGLGVESVDLVREIGELGPLLEGRTKALLELEKCWVHYVGNPSTVESYDPSRSIVSENDDQDVLVDTSIPDDLENGNGRGHRFVVPSHQRPTYRPTYFGAKVDALGYWEKEYIKYDTAVQSLRYPYTKPTTPSLTSTVTPKPKSPPQPKKKMRMKPTSTAFITFETLSSAQIASQVLISSFAPAMSIQQAPEPRDVLWPHMNIPPASYTAYFRRFVSLTLTTLLLFFWTLPIGSLAALLSYEEIKRVFPWLGHLIDQNERIRALVQHSLPTVGVVLLMAVVPMLLEGLAYGEGVRARSWVEYCVLKRYFLFLLTNVIFIFLLTSTYLQVARDLYEDPRKIPEKLAQALNGGNVRNYFVGYVILQAFGIMPLQLLNLGVVIPRIIYRAFWTRSPRDFAELNAPPLINYGAVYPPAILIFIITLLYSVIQPLILIFGTMYFGVGYVVYKYKLLFVFYKPYESHGQAWPITFTRIIWGLLIFQLFMIGNFILQKSLALPILLAPLPPLTVWWGYYMNTSVYGGLSKYVSLGSVCEVQRGAETEEVGEMKRGHPVTRSQSNLSRRRYAQNDDTLYVAPEDERTDYSQPPMSNWYYGVLNTGKRRYGHPALTGVLPTPWLPLKKGETLVNRPGVENGGYKVKGKGRGGERDNALVLTLRRRPSKAQTKKKATGTEEGGNTGTKLSHRMSYDPASGVMMLPDGGDWLEHSTDEEDHDQHDHDGSGSDDDYGTPTPSPTLNLADSQASLDPQSPGGAGASGSNIGTPMRGGAIERQTSTMSSTSQTQTPTPKRRPHGTYFHHPEKRASRSGMNMPGEFPR